MIFKRTDEFGTEYVDCKGCKKQMIKTASKVCMDCFSKGRTGLEDKMDEYKEKRQADLPDSYAKISGRLRGYRR